MPAVGDRVELELVDKERNARRYYALAVLEDPQLPLFEGEPRGLLLVLTWGRLEGARRVKREVYTAPEQLARRWRELLARRARHGYVVTRPILPAHGMGASP